MALFTNLNNFKMVKNKFHALTCVLAAILAFSSCEKPEEEYEPVALVSPELSVEITGASFTVSWEAVENAASYSYVFQDEAEETTSETSVTFSDLEPGTYTVKVKADAPADSKEYLDSEYAETTAEIKDEVKPNALATPQLTVEVSETSFTVSWTAVENAESYTYVFQDEAEETTSDTSVTFSDLEPGTYTVKVKANAPADSKEYTDSEYAETTAEIKEPEDPVALATPQLTVEVSETSFTVSWTAVENAESYSYVFLNEAEETTSETSVTFSDLEPGTYNVMVKANAPVGSVEYTDSEYAEITATIEPPAELTFEITVTDVTYNSANIRIVPSDLAAHYTYFIGYQSDLDYYTDAEEYMTVMIEYYELNIYTGELAGSVNDLPSNTEFIVVACGIDAGETITITSDVVVKPFTTEAAPVDEELEKWIGTWTATFEKTLVWSEGAQYLETSVEDRQMTKTLTMEIDPANPQQLLIYGWTSLGEDFPAHAMSGDGGTLEVYSGVQMGYADSQGITPTWTSTAELYGQLSFIPGLFPAYTFTLDGEQANSTLYEGQLQDGNTYTILGLEIYGLSETQISIYANTLPLEQPAGNATLTKVPASAPRIFTVSKSPKRVKPANLPVFPASFDFLHAE